MLRRRVLPFLLLLLALVPATTAQGAVSVNKALWGPVEFEATSLFPTYKELGAGIYMTKLEWDKVAVLEPEDARDPLDASYDWPLELDTAIDEARRNGIDVALTVTGTPEWANGGKAPRYAPANPKAYADFLTAAAERYPAVRLWVIWDGPTQSENFQPVSATRYARLLDGAYAALKGANRRNRVVGGNSFTAGKVAPQRWIRSLKLPNGKRPRMDFYGHDASSSRRPDLDARALGKGRADLSDIDTLNGWVRDAFGNKRLFVTSYALPTNANWRYDFKVSESTQASWLTAALRIAKREKYIYSLAYNGLYDEESRSDDKQLESGLLEPDGTKRPAFNAFKRG